MKIRVEASSTSHAKPTGVGLYTKRLVEALVRQKKADLFVSHFNFLGRQHKPDVEGSYHLETISFPERVYAKLHFYGIAPPIDLFRPKVDYTFFPNYVLWPTMRSRKTIVTVHDLSFVKFPEVVEVKNLAYLHKVVAPSVRKASVVLTVSETMKSEIVEHFHIPASKILVTHIPPSGIFYETSSLDVYSLYNIPTKKYMMFASTIEPRKNLSVLLRAYEKLPARLQKEYSLVIAGGLGWQSEDIAEDIKRLQKRYPNVVLTGHFSQTQAVALYQNASIFIMPSLYEGFGMPVLEAMITNTPVIASDIPVLREVCGDAGLFFPVHDETMLAHQIENLAGDVKLQKSLVKLGHKNLERFNWDSIAANLLLELEKRLKP